METEPFPDQNCLQIASDNDFVSEERSSVEALLDGLRLGAKPAIQRFFLQSLDRYIQSTEVARIVYEVIPAVMTLVRSGPNIDARALLAEHLPHLADALLAYNPNSSDVLEDFVDGSDLIVSVLCPIMCEFLSDPEELVHNAAATAFTDCLRKLKDPTGHAEGFITQWLSDIEDEDDDPACTLRFLRVFGEFVSLPFIRDVVVVNLEIYASNPFPNVREGVVFVLAALASTFYKDASIFGSAHSLFCKLGNDSSGFVRGSVIENLSKFLSAIPDCSARAAIAFPLICREASTAAVSSALCKSFGFILSTLKDEREFGADDVQLPDDLLIRFTFLADSRAPGTLEDVEMCAFHLPSVVYFYGCSKWGRLQRTFQNLARSFLVSVRRRIAASLHELAVILHENDVDRCLVPVMESFLVDLPDVQASALEHFAVFLSHISLSLRDRLLELVLECSTPPVSWRMRLSVSSQVAEILALVEQSQSSDALLSALIQDSVAVVRSETARQIPRVAVTRPDLKPTLNRLAAGLAKSFEFWRRMLFLRICRAFVDAESYSLFDAICGGSFAPLLNDSTDAIRNEAEDVVGTMSASQKDDFKMYACSTSSTSASPSCSRSSSYFMARDASVDSVSMESLSTFLLRS